MISIAEEDLKGMIVTVTLATVPFTAEEEGILIKAVVVEAGEDAVLVGLIAGLIATPGVDEAEAEEGETLMGVEEGEVGDITMIETSVGEVEVETPDEILLSVVWMIDEILPIEVWMMIIDENLLLEVWMMIMEENLLLEGWTIIITVYQSTIIMVEKEKLPEKEKLLENCQHHGTHT